MRNRRTIHASAIFGANMALLLGAALAIDLVRLIREHHYFSFHIVQVRGHG